MNANPKEYALTLARAVLGATALLHGIAETFGVWGGQRFGQTTADMAGSSTASPDTIALAVSIGMMVAGLALLLGMVTRVASLLLLAVVVWHGVANGRFAAFFGPNGCEYILALAGLAVVVATHGAGALKVDLKRESKK